MKKTIRLIMATILVGSITLVGCKKNDSGSSTDSTAELTTHADDQSRFSGETDAVANDANSAIDNFGAFEGRPGGTTGLFPLPCDATAVLDSTATDRRITITYNGTNCAGTRNRVGTVVLTMPLGQHWRDAGAVLTVNVQNLKITRLRDNRSITINGIHTITNVTGGRLYQLALHGPIVHEINSPGMTVTFDDGTSRTWMVAKRRTFSYDGGIVITTIGTHTDGATTGISEWGTNRAGHAFVTSISITNPMVIRQDCNFRLVSGELTHQRLAANVVVTFGLDATGNPVVCPNGFFYYKLVWTGANGVVRTAILPY